MKFLCEFENYFDHLTDFILNNVENETKRRERREEAVKVSSIYATRLPAATNKTLFRRKGLNVSVPPSNTWATKRVEHLINRSSTEGNSNNIRGDPRHTRCSLTSARGLPSFFFIPTSNVIPSHHKYSRLHWIIMITLNMHSLFVFHAECILVSVNSLRVLCHIRIFVIIIIY